ncbi:MAG TPA: helix-turn-helix domain-containing protein [Acidimicrobiales bacterium]|nr:helix-turn-helix domain-containing protein [Acidimicrobiales bacterium]
MTGDHPRPAELLVHLLAGRWTLAILAELATGSRRYQHLHDNVEGIAHKVLTDTLRRAERDGLVTRHIDTGHIETATLYELTPLGRSLEEPLAAFDRWVEVNWGRVEAARRDWDRRAGQP